jgi:probable phosphomutase (TIGR03848 family)
VATLILLRHGRSTSNTAGVLAGWSPGVHLDDTGTVQAAATAARLAPVPLAAIVSSPLERCLETVAPLLDGRAVDGAKVDDRLGECRYGDWTGRSIKELVKEPLWRVVQAHPSAAVFPGPDGEGLADTQVRAVRAVREWDATVTASSGADAVWLGCSHADVIKSVVADALGLHLDLFQRIVIDPCSITVIRYTEIRPFVARVNDTGGDITALLPPPRRRRRRKAAAADSDAVVGGGAGADGGVFPATTRPATR